jgi:ribosomal protein L11 methyltransferase
MTDQALQIVARGPRADAEAAARAIDADVGLEAATYSILEEDEAKGVWRIDAFPVSTDEAEGFQRVLGGWPGLSVVVEALADADWLAMALSGLPPVRAGRFFVFGQHDRGRAPPNTVNLRIEAGAAFGTGHHGTTVGCLIELDRLLKGRRFDRVLDVGAGTGVLAIAAARTGSRIVLGTDIDRPSVRIAGENARLNHARARFHRASGLSSRTVAREAPYNLIFANILARPLVSLAPSIARALAPGGRVILSGLLRSQERRVRAAYLAQGLRFERRLYRDAWVTLVMARGPAQY